MSTVARPVHPPSSPVTDPGSAQRRTVAARDVLRFGVELASFAALGYGGASAGGPSLVRAALAIGAPAAAIAIWALWLAPRAPGRLADPGRLLLELAVFAAAAVALGRSASPAAGVALGLVAAGNAVALRMQGGRVR